MAESSQQQNPVERKKRKITDPVMARVALAEGNYTTPLPDKDRIACAAIRDIIDEADRKIAAIFLSPPFETIAAITISPPSQASEADLAEAPYRYLAKVSHDTGRVMHGFDLMKLAKSSFVDAILLKHVVEPDGFESIIRK